MLEQTFPGNSEMARRMRELDWSQTPLGSVDRWPHSLRSCVCTSLSCAFPIVIWWGPELAILYNDEYRPMLGAAKHPAALGQRGAAVWAEIWDVIYPMLSQVMERGEATRSRDLLLQIDREGYLEEAYFSFSYSPILDDRGDIGGVFCPVIETTGKVIGERRLRTLRDLANRCKGADSETSVYTSAARVLADNPYDVPFAMIYRADDTRTTAELRAATGIQAGSPACPVNVVLHENQTGLWSLNTVAQSGSFAVVADLSRSFDTLPAGAWTRPPHSAIVLPVLLPGQDRPRAMLVCAVSPVRALNEDYRTFFGLIAIQIASALADAQALEEERRRAEALAEIDRAKTAFFSNVSHEFRTPLTLMLGPIEDALGHGDLPEDIAASLTVAHRNSLRLLKLVNTLLDFARIEAGRVEANYEPTDLGTLTAELASVFRSAIEKAGLRLIVDCPALAKPAYVDRDMWEKIVLNLLSNAFKFTFDGEIAISLRCRGDRIELAVSDTGIGISQADLPEIFQRFHRVKNARSRTHEGTGIGLALVQELVKLHGGEISVDSREGCGSTFLISIPTGQAHLPAERIGAGRQLASTALGATPFVEEALRWLPGDAQTEWERDTVGEIAPLPALTASRAPARVLLADDNADMREYIRRLLGRSFLFEAVADGQAALEKIHADPPDLVLADVMMPRLDGFGLLDAIRANARTRTLPVIMLSARAGEESRIEGLSAGVDDYLTKPFSARELLTHITSQLDLARLRRETEQAIRYRGEQFETLLNQAPLGVYLIDAEFRVRAANPIALAVFGDIPGGVIGHDFDEIIHLLWEKDYADQVVDIFRRALETGEPYIVPERAEFRIDRGVTEYYEWRIDRITLPDGRYGLVCYFRDISRQVLARKQIEESREALREADRRKDEFLATLAHELRNPLAAIRNGLLLLQSGGDSESAEAVQETMDRQINHLVRLVDDLMEVSRITRGKIELRKEHVELAEVVRGAIETSKPLIDAGGQQLTITMPAEPLIVVADSVRLAQVLTNLLSNAAKYTQQEGSIWLTVARNGSSVAVSVRDNGIGIPADALLKVFDLFTQIERSYDRAQGGLGIGLTLVRSLVHLHDGTVEAKSDGPGRGSEFTIRLPLITGTAEPDVKNGWQGLQSVIAAQRILVVDDNQDAAQTLAMLLKRLGADVYVAGDGSAALEALRIHNPSVMLLDIGLPGMDGYEVARRAREQLDGTPLKIIALTGWGQEEDRRRSKQAGIDHHLVKPIDIRVLEQLLSSAPPAAQTVPA